MGSGRFDAQDWAAYKSSKGHTAATPVHQVFTAKSVDKSLSPYGIKGRESCDSADNPNSTALIVSLDVTGSMEGISNVMQKDGLPTLMREVYARQPIPDPHLMFHGVDDVTVVGKDALQITQFEADVRIADQLEKIWLVGHGGGNGSESYALSWWFAAKHTTIDCWEKRKKKGYLFTIGDDGPTPLLTREQIKQVHGYLPEEDVDIQALLTEVSRKWEVFHIMVEQGATHSKDIEQRWRKLLGERAILLSDYTKLAETIVSILQIHQGADQQAVAASWDGTTSLVVAQATQHLTQRQQPGELVTL